MAVRRPTLDQLRSVAEDLGMHMGDEELKSYDTLMQGNYAAYDIVDAMPRVIRLMALVNTTLSSDQIAHVYLRGAATLRRDLAQ